MLTNLNNINSWLLALKILLSILLFFVVQFGFSQISPGDLSAEHAHLEGMSNCTECHTLGEKVSNAKCLECHTLLKDRIDSNKGYHSSDQIAGKDCIVCHSDHHGRKFEMIRFDKNEFDHSKTGYELLGVHKKQECEKCHKKEFIVDIEVKKKDYTYLGLETDCISCHDDYHQKTLSSDCSSCHDFNAFKPTTTFNHDKTKFRLIGKHQKVECISCHKITTLNGNKFQEFANIPFESCTSCHKDIHDNKFGQNCTQCHDEQSFHVISSMDAFDHSKTRFKLEAKHQFVDCKKCHKTKLTDPVKHNRCTDCHKDYHESQFAKPGKVSDCSDCHSTQGFVGSSFTIERHDKTEFPLSGAHLATPCFVCHKKEAKWNFKIAGSSCIDCHDNIHERFIDQKYYPDASCKSCHNENQWANVVFDHSKTEYELLGEHKNQSCRACHFKPVGDGRYEQRFSILNDDCTNCHTDKHFNQFENNGVTNCFACHDYNNWKANKFDHNKTRFVLDGKHQYVACAACHKKQQIGQDTYVLYKLNKLKCENCH